MCEYVFLLNEFLREDKMNHTVEVHLNISKTVNFFLKCFYHFNFSTALYVNSSSCQSFPTVDTTSLLIRVILVGRQWYTTVVLICISYWLTVKTHVHIHFYFLCFGDLSGHVVCLFFNCTICSPVGCWDLLTSFGY